MKLTTKGRGIWYFHNCEPCDTPLLGKSYIIAGEFLSPSKVTRCG